MRALLLAALIGASLLQTAAAADEVADFYHGKTVNLIVGSAPGGGYDAVARIVARYLGRHIPGAPTVVVQNMPGAGQSLAANYVYAIAPKDGTSIVATSPGALLAPLLGGPKVRFDPTKFNYLGSGNQEYYACYARADAPVKTFSDTFTTDWIIGVTSGTTRDMPSALLHILGARLKLVTGYKNSKDAVLAMERGEVQGLCGVGYETFAMLYPQQLAEGRIKVIVQASVTGHPVLDKQGVPLATSFAKTEEQRRALELVFGQGVFGRPLAVAPEVPAARVAALREAFMAAMKDPEQLEEAHRMQLDVNPLSGEQVQAALAAAYASPPAVVEMARKALDAEATR